MAKKAFTPLKKYSFKVVLAPLFKAFECVCELLVPFLVKDIIDLGVANRDFDYVLQRSLIMLALAIAGFGVTMVTQYLAARVSADYAYDLKKDLYGQLDSLSDGQIERFGQSKALTLINNDSFSLQVGVNMFMRLFVRAPFLLIGTVIMSFYLSPLAGAVVLTCLLLSSLVIFLVMALTPKKYQALQKDLDTISCLGEDGLSGARVIRAFDKEKEEEAKFSSAAKSYQKKALAISKINGLINPLTFAFINLGVLFVLYIGGYQGSSSPLSVGSLMALINYLFQALTALIIFSRLITSLAKAMASKKRVDGFLALEPEIRGGHDQVPSFAKGDELFRLQGVDLFYGGENAALKNIDLTIRAGEKIGVIGGTGSGKSTLIALLERFVDPSHGEVYFLNKDIKDYDLGSLRSTMALVSQKPQIYRGSVKSNLLLARPSATLNEIDQALKDAMAYDFVYGNKDGLDHPLKEGGVNLSGGQKQRLLIARALLSERPILILDDSTSALDYQTDAALRHNLAKRPDLTLIMVSQRATSLQGSDRIYVLDEGRLVDQGRHQELLASCSIYQEIYQTQVAVK